MATFQECLMAYQRNWSQTICHSHELQSFAEWGFKLVT
jgi:hypothetical protein